MHSSSPIYAIGDLQGCAGSLEQLLASLPDTTPSLIFAGDLINRGPQSLHTLRTVMQMGERAQSVLGNHDLHLLAVACGIRPAHRDDTLDDILNAPDREELIDWLRPADASLARELRQVQQVRDASAFFLVAYGASRWVDLQQQVPRVGALPLPQQRWHRVASLFDNRGLVPLAGWLPAYAAQNPGRYRQVVNLMNRLLPQGCLLHCDRVFRS